MIVNLMESGWEVIYHRAHALLAAQVGGHWRKNDMPERIYETLAAISHHDDLEREWQGNQITPAGAPLDFTLDPESSIEKLEKHIQEGRYRGRWVTLLTSKHICFICQAKQDESDEWRTFLKEQTELQQKYAKELGIEKDEVERAYQFMRWCDRTSLILTQKQIPQVGRALEITSGIDGQRYDIRELPDGHITVEPWPFEDDIFTVNVEASLLSELKYESSEQLVSALKEAPLTLLEWTFAKKEGLIENL
jgi:Protein of unknown function (DUF3891)